MDGIYDATVAVIADEAVRARAGRRARPRRRRRARRAPASAGGEGPPGDVHRVQQRHDRAARKRAVRRAREFKSPMSARPIISRAAAARRSRVAFRRRRRRRVTIDARRRAARRAARRRSSCRACPTSSASSRCRSPTRTSSASRRAPRSSIRRCWRRSSTPSRASATRRRTPARAGSCRSRRETARYIAHLSGGTAFEQGDLATPQVNISYGAFYLRYLLGRYDGNTVLALAAYNGGEGNVDRWIARGEPVPSAAFGREQIPFTETREYVDRVLDARASYREKYSRELGL